MRTFKFWKLQSHGWLSAGLLAAASLSWLPGSVIAQQPTPVDAGVGAAGEKRTETKADFAITIGEQLQLMHDRGGLIEEIIPSRPGLLEITPIANDPRAVMVKGKEVGLTVVTIRGKDKNNNPLEPTVKVIAVNPDITYIKSKIREAFPNANVLVTPGGSKGAYIVSGTLENAEEALALETFVNDMVITEKGAENRRTLVTYNLRIAGVHVVQLDVCIAQVDRSKVRRLGFSFLQNDSRSFVGSALGGSVTGATTNTAPGLGSFTATAGFGSATGANQIVFGINNATSAFTGLVSALKTERAGKLLANPILVAMSGRPATFTVGGEEPFGTAGSGGGTGAGVQFKQVGTVVGFLPMVIADGRIRLTVSAQNSNVISRIDTGSIIAPIISTNSVGTTVELENGQSVVIGGLLQNKVAGNTSKLPFLGELPFVGSAFRSVSYDESEMELIILVKAALVHPLDSNQRAAVKLPGQETRAPSDFELYLEGILEAPRGPRDPFPCRNYVPAFKNEPPFGSRNGECNNGGAAGAGCSTGNCGKVGQAGHTHTMAPMMQMPAQTMVQGQTPVMVVPATVEVPAIQVQGTVVPSITAPTIQETVPVIKVPESLPVNSDIPLLPKIDTNSGAPSPVLVPETSGTVPEAPKPAIPAGPNG